MLSLMNHEQNEQKFKGSLIFFFNKPLVRERRYLLSIVTNISYFIVRYFDVKHHAAHATILIIFGSEKRSYIF
jgi:hypothetical protein